MAVFGGLMLTNSGRNLEAKAQLGKTLKLKRIALGDGQITSESMLTIKNLINETLSCEIKNIKLLEDNIVKVTFYLTNQSLEQGFNWRELGVIAEDPDTEEEVLFCYGNARENAEYISAKNEQDILELDVSIDLIISNVENITAVINESLTFATKKELQEIIDNLDISSAKSQTITLSASNWIQNEDTGYYENNIEDEEITENHTIYGSVHLSDAGKISRSVTESYNGGFKVRTTEEVKENVTIDFVIFKTTPKEGS